MPCTAETVLILSVDGKGIVMRPESLTESTRKAAEAKAANKMRTRLAPGEKPGRKPAAGPKTFNKWLTGSVADNTQTVMSAVFDQAEQIEQILTEATVR